MNTVDIVSKSQGRLNSSSIRHHVMRPIKLSFVTALKYYGRNVIGHYVNTLCTLSA